MASESTKQLMYLSQQVSPTLAAILNFFFPGVGYWYAGYSVIFAIGVFVFVTLAAFFTLGLAMVVITPALVIDGVMAARRFNKKLAQELLASEDGE